MLLPLSHHDCCALVLSSIKFYVACCYYYAAPTMLLLLCRYCAAVEICQQPNTNDPCNPISEQIRNHLIRSQLQSETDQNILKSNCNGPRIYKPNLPMTD
ncbi:hypothetical protein VNO77_20294 [Canavalia gladiata]|uniref:Uncharacterized protein n=1 Tax=Canavalia gladiata TaxID=3824 RepID=A0AAN9LPC2_CANGL